MYVKFFRVREIFGGTQGFAGFAVCSFCVKSYYFENVCNLRSRLFFHQKLLMNRLLSRTFVVVNGIVFNRSNGFMIKGLIACLMNQKR